MNVGFNLFDPIEGLNVPKQFEEKVYQIDHILQQLLVLHLEN